MLQVNGKIRFKFAEELRLMNYIKFTGAVSRKEIPASDVVQL